MLALLTHFLLFYLLKYSFLFSYFFVFISKLPSMKLLTIHASYWLSMLISTSMYEIKKNFTSWLFFLVIIRRQSESKSAFFPTHIYGKPEKEHLAVLYMCFQHIGWGEKASYECAFMHICTIFFYYYHLIHESLFLLLILFHFIFFFIITVSACLLHD